MRGVQRSSTSWRSWPWNLWLAGLTSMFVLFTGYVVVTDPALPARIIFAVMAVVLTVGAGRALLLGVTARPDGVRIRELFSTTVLPWADIERIEMGEQTEGPAAALFELEAPAVTLRRRDGEPRYGPDGEPDDEPEEIELTVLGTYRLLRFMSPARRAVAELNAALDEWRRQHPD